MAATLGLLGACGSPNDPGVGGVTKAEAEALNEAAEALDIEQNKPAIANGTREAAPVPVKQP